MSLTGLKFLNYIQVNSAKNAIVFVGFFSLPILHFLSKVVVKKSLLP